MVPSVGEMSVTTQRSWGYVLGLVAAADPNTLQEQDLEAGVGRGASFPDPFTRERR